MGGARSVSGRRLRGGRVDECVKGGPVWLTYVGAGHAPGRPAGMITSGRWILLVEVAVAAVAVVRRLLWPEGGEGVDGIVVGMRERSAQSEEWTGDGQSL